MRIDGKEIAGKILQDLSIKVTNLKKRGITPTMAIILMGNNKASEIYVKQKILKAQSIGAEVELFRFPGSITEEKIKKVLEKIIHDKKIHGIILQRPAPSNIDADKLTKLVPAEKEIDGFGDHPSYPVPVAWAVIEILQSIFEHEKPDKIFTKWLMEKSIVLLGKGETAGKPIYEQFRKLNINPTLIDSKTQKRSQIIKSADIIVSSVGKKVIFPSEIKKGVILIGVGLFTNSEGKLKGDYEDEEIKDIASYYSPTPGGVGPVNVACLLQNLLNSAGF